MQRPKIQSGHPATEKTHPNGTEIVKEAQIQFSRRICVLSPAQVEVFFPVEGPCRYLAISIDGGFIKALAESTVGGKV